MITTDGLSPARAAWRAALASKDRPALVHASVMLEREDGAVASVNGWAQHALDEAHVAIGATRHSPRRVARRLSVAQIAWCVERARRNAWAWQRNGRDYVKAVAVKAPTDSIGLAILFGRSGYYHKVTPKAREAILARFEGDFFRWLSPEMAQRFVLWHTEVNT